MIRLPPASLTLGVLMLALPPVARAQSGAAERGAGPAARRALEQPGFHWRTRTTAHATLHLRAGSAGARRAELPDEVERAIAANLDWLGEGQRAKGLRLHLFFVGSREEMRPLTGGTPGGHAIPEEGTAFFVATDSVPPALRHELMHLLSWRLWGAPGGEWLSEGVATAAAGRCNEWSIEETGAALDRAKRLVPFDTLRRGFVFAGDTGVVHYLQSASIVRYVDRAYGRRGVRALWASGLAGVRKSLGVDAATLERGWRADLARREAPASWATMSAAIRAHGCESGGQLRD